MDGVLSTGLLRDNGVQASPEDVMFVRSLVTNLVVYGYTNFRLIANVDDDQPVFQVPRGADCAVRFDQETLTWKADIQKGSMDPALDVVIETVDMFQTIVLAPPLETRPDGYVARAYRDAEQLEIIRTNLIKRDLHNSTPAVFTFVDNASFQTRGRAGGQGWLSSGLDIDNNMEGATRSLTYDDLIAARSEMVQSAAMATDRESAPRSMVGAGLPMGLPSDEPQEESEMNHKEHVLTDGRKMTATRHLNGPEQYLLLYQRYRQTIFQTLGIPPQALGESVSAERVGSNHRSTSEVLEAWTIRKAMIRKLLQPALTVAGLVWGKRVDNLRYERILPVLRHQKAVEVTAEVLGIDSEDIDPLRVKVLQDQMLFAGSKTASANDPESLKAPERRHKTEADKEQTEGNRDLRET